MNKVFKTAAAAFLAVCASVSAVNAATPEQSAPAEVAIPSANVPDPGFVGNPFLSKYGYQAYNGAFSIEVGQGMSNLDFLTDSDPENYCTAAGIGATVALDQLCVVSPDRTTEKGASAPYYHSGDVIGYVLSDGSNSGSVLNLNLIKMFVIYLYNGKELVHTFNAKGSELDILGLSLISYGAGQQTIKLPVPKDDKGNDIVFDGIGIGVAGVDVNAIEQVRIHYAFVDKLAEVPIIKRYFRNASAKLEGMVSGANNLVNNNLNDGAVTAVLNIGGAYYDVYAGEPIPTGIEAGFHITSGSALNVDLGKAIRIQAIVKDSDGNYKKINLSTGFDVVGLQLAGGGETECTAMIPAVLTDDEGNTYTEFYGLRLERISGVNVDLGATVVHYAYVKVPVMPQEQTPFLANMYVIPSAHFTHHEFQSFPVSYTPAKQKLTNHLLLRNSKEKPLLTRDLMPEAYRDGGESGPSRSHPYAMLSLFKNIVYANGTESEIKYEGAICIWTDDKEWFYGYQKKGQSYLDVKVIKIPGPDANGVIDFGDIELELDSQNESFEMEENDTNRIASFNYWLYVHERKDDTYKSMENGYELDYSDVVVPQIAVDFEVAGVLTIDELKDKDTDSAPSDQVQVNAFKNYIEVVVPDLINYKTEVEKVTVYRHVNDPVDWGNSTNTEQYKDAVTIKNGVVTIPENSTNDIKYVHKNGATKIVFGIESIDTNDNQHNYFLAEVSAKLTDAYTKELCEAFDRNEFPIDATYAWVHTKEGSHNLPVISHVETNAYELYWSEEEREKVLRTKFTTQLNAAAAGHTAAGEILYSQWVTLNSASAASAPKKVAPAAGVEGEQVQHTAFNSGQNYDPETQYSSDGTSHDATLYASHEIDGKVRYNMTTRAYVPVLPSGFTAEDMEPSYLVTEAKTEGTASEPTLTGIEDVEESNAAPEYFNLQGLRVASPEAGNVYIVRRGSTVSKILY